MQVELQVVQSSHGGSTRTPFDGQSISLTSDKFIIGRARDCHFCPDSKLLSRYHCVLLQDGYTVRIRDLGSKNGTFVNSQRTRFDVVLSNLLSG